MEILLGLVAAVGWGAGDFLARYAALRIGSYRTLFFIQFVGLISLGAYLLATGELQTLLTSTTWYPWAWALAAVTLNVLSSLALYRSFEIGKIALVSPITGSYAAITVVLSLLSGEKLTLLHAFAIGLVLLGVIVASIAPTPADNAQQAVEASQKTGALHGVGWAICSAVGYGVTFWILGFHVTPTLGGLTPVWLVRLLTPCLLMLCAPLVRQSLHMPRGMVWWFIGGVSILDTVAYMAYAVGLTAGKVAIMTILASLYSVVTVLLAWIFLREQLLRRQWLGIIVVFAGIALVNVMG